MQIYLLKDSSRFAIVICNYFMSDGTRLIIIEKDTNCAYRTLAPHLDFRPNYFLLRHGERREKEGE
jgi:hypothetical protein